MAGPSKDASGKIVRSNGGGQTMAQFLTGQLAPAIKLALPKHLDPDRMLRIALTALRGNRKLEQCDQMSFAACVVQSAQLGLEVNTPMGHAYLIPRRNKRTNSIECTLLIGYVGMLELARRSGQVSSIFAYTVHHGDTFEYELGLDPKLRHVPGDDEQSWGNMTHVYAVAKLKGTEDRQFVVLTKRAVEERKARGASGPAWSTDPLAMAKKTAVRALFTWLPKSPEMARAAVVDDSEVTGKPMIDVETADSLAAANLPVPDFGDDDGVSDAEWSDGSEAEA